MAFGENELYFICADSDMLSALSISLSLSLTLSLYFMSGFYFEVMQIVMLIS